jgi:hypothetical protein
MSSTGIAEQDQSLLSTYYLYDPNLGANAFFMASFYLFSIALLIRSIQHKSWLTGTLLAFSLSEAGGYTARLIFADGDGKGYLHDAFLAQLIIIILAPNFAQAFLYTLISKLIAWTPIDTQYYIKRFAKWIPTCFILSDLLCLVLQAIGGAILSNNDNTQEQNDRGKAIELAGLGLQLGCLALFVLIVVFYLMKCPRESYTKATGIVLSTILAIVLIVARNAYRVAEFAEGSFTKGSLEEHEAYYFLGEALPMWLVCAVFIAFDIPRRLTDIDIDPHTVNTASAITVKPSFAADIEMATAATVSLSVDTVDSD